jgi:AmmeMemoRadiSam system protein B/AmmeMemoRadiSam system protein A
MRLEVRNPAPGLSRMRLIRPLKFSWQRAEALVKRTRWSLTGILLSLVLLGLAACGPSPQIEPTATPIEETLEPPTTRPSQTPGLTSTPKPGDVHWPEGAGRWYPADPSSLQATVDDYVGQAEMEPIPGRVVAVIVPHAGYLYSGAVAGYAFRALREAGCAGHTIAVIGDSHSGNGSAEIAVWAAGAFETPLGRTPVDEEVAQALVAADKRIEFDRKAFQLEHPVENQLPFIQTVCPGARLVPIVIRQPSLENAQILADALVEAFGNQPALVVASTDLSHYHTYDEARKMDEVALQAIVSLDPQAVADSPRRCTELGLGGGDPLTMCSQGAVMTALIAATQMGADRATVLHYANSGDVAIGERDQVVGYGAVALWQASSQPINQQVTFTLPPSQPENAGVLPISSEAQKELLALARRTAEQFLATESLPAFETDDPALLQPMGAYVTYEKEGELRGCLGRLEGDRPAYLNVQYAALAAALGDPRFPAITAEELNELTLEITLLQPMHQVQSPEEIQIGRDGVLMRVGEKDGALFLPQVPLEQGWDLKDTLLNLCRKAGLPDDAWQRPDAHFYVFAGQWFGEDE